MKVFISEAEYSLSVKGEGCVGVGFSDGTNTVVLARLRNGHLGWLCSRCAGEGLVVGDRFANRRRPRCSTCRGTGIVNEYVNVDAAAFAARRYLEQLSLPEAEREAVWAERQVEWWQENTELVQAAKALAEPGFFVKKMLRKLKRGFLWSPHETMAMRRVVAEANSDSTGEFDRFVGEPGQRIEFTGVINRTGYREQFNTRTFIVSVAADGEMSGVLLWSQGVATALRSLYGCDGDWIRGTALVKQHLVHRGQHRTVVTNMKLAERNEDGGADRSGWPGQLIVTDGRGATHTRPVRDRWHARALLHRVFTEIGHGPIESAELRWDGASIGTPFAAHDVLGEDPSGVYAALMDVTSEGD